MKILIVASGNANYISPFILDQVEALKRQEINIDYFIINGKGLLGYTKNFGKLLDKINEFKPNIIHAHYGLSGLLSGLQRKIPVVTTFHGSDINIQKIRFFSKIADKLSFKSIFVSKDLAVKLNKKDPIIVPCGVDLDIFYPAKKELAKEKLQLSLNKKHLLFSSSFSDKVKNYPLAKEAISKLNDQEIELIELKGFQREEVALLMNAVDAVLMTSFNEGSPQFIKEAMACNTPIVCTDVGDVKDIINETKGCYIVKNDAHYVSVKIREALKFNGKTLGRKNIDHLDNKFIAARIKDIYSEILNN